MRFGLTWIIIFGILFSLASGSILDALRYLVNSLLENPIDAIKYAKQQYPVTKNIKDEYDVVIVGAGAAGCVLANRLSEISSLKILLLEAGGKSSLVYDIPATTAIWQRSVVDWAYRTMPIANTSFAMDNHENTVPKGKLVGGSTGINFMIYTRGNRKDYDRWRDEFKNPGWGFDDFEKYFKKMEDYHVSDDTDENYFGRDGAMYIQKSPYKSRLSSAILKASEEYGFKILNYNGPDQLGMSYLQSLTKDGYRVSANRGYLVPIRDTRPNLTLKINSFVTKILFDTSGGEPVAKGVEYMDDKDKTHTVYAKRQLIISAGAISTPQILMLSGIGHAEHLKDMGIPLVKDLPVGDNMWDHYSTVVEFEVKKPQFQNILESVYPITKSGPLSIPSFVEVIGYSHPREDGVPQIEHFFFTVPMNPIFQYIEILRNDVYLPVYAPYELKPGFIVCPTILHPLSRGFIRLNSTNPKTHPNIFSNFLSHPEEVELMMKAIREVLSIAEQPALKNDWGTKHNPIPNPHCKHLKFLSDEYLRCFIQQIGFSIYHQAGTCKMGPKIDPTAVVGPDLKVHGIRNLRIVDASITPTSISGHMTAPTLAIAEKSADIIKVDLSEPK